MAKLFISAIVGYAVWHFILLLRYKQPFHLYPLVSNGVAIATLTTLICILFS